VDDAKRIAAIYIAEIRTVQPHGPYYLGGGCIGGVIAYEMAQQLVAQGEEVAFLALMDAYNPAHSKMISRSRYFYCHARFLAQRLTGRARRVAQNAVSRLLRKQEGKRAVNCTAASFPTASEKGGKANDPVRALQQRVRDANYRAGWAYVPSPYFGKITLFGAATRMQEPYQDPFYGWKPLAIGGLDIEIVPGRHASFDREVHGKLLDRYLREAQRSDASRAPAPQQPRVPVSPFSFRLGTPEAA
jgi:thioesterase domain-containing protein